MFGTILSREVESKIAVSISRAACISHDSLPQGQKLAVFGWKALPLVLIQRALSSAYRDREEIRDILKASSSDRRNLKR